MRQLELLGQHAHIHAHRLHGLRSMKHIGVHIAQLKLETFEASVRSRVVHSRVGQQAAISFKRREQAHDVYG